jgi:hypothetical protein
MRMTAIRIQNQRKPQDRSARRAEKRAHRARMMRVRGPIRPTPCAVATSGNAQEKNTCSEGMLTIPAPRRLLFRNSLLVFESHL